MIIIGKDVEGGTISANIPAFTWRALGKTKASLRIACVPSEF
jgi:hypothetical protein